MFNLWPWNPAIKATHGLRNLAVGEQWQHCHLSALPKYQAPQGGSELGQILPASLRTARSEPGHTFFSLYSQGGARPGRAAFYLQGRAAPPSLCLSRLGLGHAPLPPQDRAMHPSLCPDELKLSHAVFSTHAARLGLPQTLFHHTTEWEPGCSSPHSEQLDGALPDSACRRIRHCPTSLMAKKVEQQ